MVSNLTIKMSDLEYLDAEGTVNFRFVPWQTLNDWLSELNGCHYVTGTLREGVNRGKVIEELNSRRNMTPGFLDRLALNRGYGEDWREYENVRGLTHFEELLVYQPKDWRKQAREYIYRYAIDVERTSKSGLPMNHPRRVVIPLGTSDDKKEPRSITLDRPSLIVLLHPDLKRSQRYQPLNFLLSYGVKDPIPLLGLTEEERLALVKELSPLDFFFFFAENVQAYDLESLRQLGRKIKLPRLCLIKELDFSDIIGQRMAKHMIRAEVVDHLSKRRDDGAICKDRRPLSLIFAGPSGNGKTEMSVWLADLLNKPNDNAFIKIDCGKLRNANEIFGMSGAYQGAQQGSALNNFVLNLSANPDAFGIILLDEIEKADSSVIEGLFNVLDKGEWTNKRLERGGTSQTFTIPCHNLIFIMTTNAADSLVIDFAASKQVHGIASTEDMDNAIDEVELLLRRRLQNTYPFQEAFIGRIGRIVPFFPLAQGDLNENLLLGEAMTVAKYLIEREQDRLNDDTFQVEQVVSAKEKHRMAQIIVKEAVPEAGVRSIRNVVESRMTKRLRHNLLLEKRSILSLALKFDSLRTVVVWTRRSVISSRDLELVFLRTTTPKKKGKMTLCSSNLCSASALHQLSHQDWNQKAPQGRQ